VEFFPKRSHQRRTSKISVLLQKRNCAQKTKPEDLTVEELNLAKRYVNEMLEEMTDQIYTTTTQINRLIDVEVTDETDFFQCPHFVLGETGEVAMTLWETVYNEEGDYGIQRTEEELKLLGLITYGRKEWLELVSTPLIPQETKDSILVQQLEDLHYSPQFIEYMMTIFHSGCAHRLQQIINDFVEINREFRHEVEVKLITGEVLDQSSVEFYKNSITLDYLEPEDQVIFTHVVDSSIIGYKVLIKKQVYDFSESIEGINTKLVSMRNNKDPREIFMDQYNGIFHKSKLEQMWNSYLTDPITVEHLKPMYESAQLLKQKWANFS